MARPDPDVKPDSRRALIAWLDAHPRTGWYCAFILTLNFILNLMDAIDVDPLWFMR